MTPTSPLSDPSVIILTPLYISWLLYNALVSVNKHPKENLGSVILSPKLNRVLRQRKKM